MKFGYFRRDFGQDAVRARNPAERTQERQITEALADLTAMGVRRSNTARALARPALTTCMLPPLCCSLRE